MTPRDFLTRRRFLGLAASAGACCSLPAVAAAGPAAVPALAPSLLDRDSALVRRGAWTGDRPRYDRLSPAGAFDRVTLHHSGRPGAGIARGAVLRSLQGMLDAHRARGFGDIGYHFVVDATGRAWEGRSLEYEGAHVAGQNAGNLGIALLGNFETERPTPAQIRTAVRLLTRLRDRFGIRADRTYGHRDLAATACPGKYLYRYLAGLREQRET